MLLVDAAQGIEAQTLANLYLALDRDLHIIPVLNKIDLPAADPDRYAGEIAHIIGCEPSDVLRVSGKTGDGVADLLDHVVREVPAPQGDADAPTRAMIFDSVYDIYRGVVTYVRVVDGKILPRERIKMMSTGANHELLEVGIVSPDPKPSAGLGVGEVGYLITGVKDVRQSKVGDTVTTARHGATEALTGYREPKPMVYSGLYPVDGSDYPDLRDALDRLQLNDAALVWEPETSVALGFGFRCGFLGWTGYAPSVWGTAVNAGMQVAAVGARLRGVRLGRVEVPADRPESRSQAAIARLGAVREGVPVRDRRPTRPCGGNGQPCAAASILIVAASVGVPACYLRAHMVDDDVVSAPEAQVLPVHFPHRASWHPTWNGLTGPLRRRRPPRPLPPQRRQQTATTQSWLPHFRIRNVRSVWSRS